MTFDAPVTSAPPTRSSARRHAFSALSVDGGEKSKGYEVKTNYRTLLLHSECDDFSTRGIHNYTVRRTSRRRRRRRRFFFLSLSLLKINRSFVTHTHTHTHTHL